MIIFDLDGTLADCEHRRHFVDPKKHPHLVKSWVGAKECFTFIDNDIHKIWKPDWQAFYQACDKDTLIQPTNTIISNLFSHDYYGGDEDVVIWSGRCQSVREKTETWLSDHYIYYNELKMRPIGDNTPDEILKERWLDEALSQGKTIDFVVDSNKKFINICNCRNIFVFDISQGKGDF
jgi:hypothetical protein